MEQKQKSEEKKKKKWGGGGGGRCKMRSHYGKCRGMLSVW